MSVAAQLSPFCGSKRVHSFETEADEGAENFSVGAAACSLGSTKRSRFVASPLQSGRCTPLSERQAYVVSASTVAALRGLFPDMEEQTISTVLRECGDDIDSAIRRLNELKLGGGRGGVESAAGPAANQSQQQEQPVAAAGPETSTAQQTAQQQGQDVPGQQQPAQPTIDLGQWVETVVSQMAGASDVGDARQRAASVLQAFASSVAEALGKDEREQLRAQAAELAKDNSILKRAVAIQNSRLQELSAREDELAALRQMLAQYQEKVHALEMSNYSLALHLKQATCAADPNAQHSQRHPDVF